MEGIACELSVFTEYQMDGRLGKKKLPHRLIKHLLILLAGIVGGSNDTLTKGNVLCRGIAVLHTRR